MGALTTDVAFALRLFRRRASFSIVAVATLGLGIGAATAMFTIAEGVLLRPLPYARSAELVTVWQTDTRYLANPILRARAERLWFSYPEYRRWRDEQRTLADAALYGQQQKALTGAGDATEVDVYTATANLLPLLGVDVAAGRWFLPGEEGPGAERLAVLSHGLWAARFGADTSAIGRFITLDDQPYRIVGVLPPAFRLRSLSWDTTGNASVWIPLGSDGGADAADSSYEAIARLRPDVPVSAASAESDRIVRAVSGRAERGARVLPRIEAETANARAPLLLLAAGVGLLLLIACANTAILLLGEAPARTRELLTRTALGAPARRITTQLLTESVLLALAGGIAGTAIAAIAVRGLIALAPPGIPRLAEIAVDGRILTSAIGLSFATAIGFGLVPAISAARSSSRTTSSGERLSGGVRLQHAAIAAQIALALVLLAGSGLLVRSLHRLTIVDPGFRPAGVLTMSITAPEGRYASRPAVAAYFDQLEERLSAVPGVRRVSATANLPFAGRNLAASIEIESAAGPQAATAQRRVVRDDYFETMGIPLRAGRTFPGADRSAAENVMVVDEAMARRFWPAESAVGKRVRFTSWFTVIGVVGSVRHGRLDEQAQPTFYIPHARLPTREMAVVVRTDGDPLRLSDAVRQAVWSVDSSVPVAELSTMEARVERSIGTERYRTTLLSVFSGAAALLTAVGVLGVSARAVGQRRKEIGIRLALGAGAWPIVRTVLGAHTRSVLIGIVVGLVAIRAAAPVLSRFVFAIGPSDVATLLSTAGIVGAVSVCASLPAIRTAMRVDPMRALRE